MSNLPDRTGILVSPLCAFLAGSIFSALLVTSAMNERDASRKVIDQMLVALGHALGVGPSIGVAAVVTMSSLVWLVMRYRYYRSRVAEDRRAAGLA
ncbi:MAG: hypothetical protein JNK04_23425 [Myxococcales bacterium]|nr:hypothetical protein [Myxococcales bacterium]